MNYTEAVEYINEIPKFTTKNKFEHTKEMMRRLGNPEAHMKIIHVAGTNGKVLCVHFFPPCWWRQESGPACLPRPIW